MSQSRAYYEACACWDALVLADAAFTEWACSTELDRIEQQTVQHIARECDRLRRVSYHLCENLYIYESPDDWYEMLDQGLIPSQAEMQQDIYSIREIKTNERE